MSKKLFSARYCFELTAPLPKEAIHPKNKIILLINCPSPIQLPSPTAQKKLFCFFTMFSARYYKNAKNFISLPPRRWLPVATAYRRPERTAETGMAESGDGVLLKMKFFVYHSLSTPSGRLSTVAHTLFIVIRDIIPPAYSLHSLPLSISISIL